MLEDYGTDTGKSATARSATSRSLLGEQGEEAATQFLQRQGLTLIGRNIRHGHCEIDALFVHDGVLIVVEVKTRSSNRFGDGFDAVTPLKQQHLRRAIVGWLHTQEAWFSEIRFDIVVVTPMQTSAGQDFLFQHSRGVF
ncbi:MULTISPECIES: YraN family protein [unclassified Corynebacterium]|uniref:YraN family protein n=1 Tax=unclassified Corynebacterium TaxID=2624378 RepID=UPI0030AD6128